MSYLMNPGGADLIIHSHQRDLAASYEAGRAASAVARSHPRVSVGGVARSLVAAADRLSASVHALAGGLSGRRQIQ
jgi:hypothetical protein